MSTREPGSEARWRADPRLPAYLVAGFGALVAALATGQAVLVALGAPFLVLAALGLSDREPFALAGAVELDALRAVEGGEVAGTVTVGPPPSAGCLDGGPAPTARRSRARPTRPRADGSGTWRVPRRRAATTPGRGRDRPA